MRVADEDVAVTGQADAAREEGHRGRESGHVAGAELEEDLSGGLHPDHGVPL